MDVALSHRYGPSRLPGPRDAFADHLHVFRDEMLVRVRAIGPGDAEWLQAGFARLSPESRYRRFFTPVPRLTRSMLERLTATDGWNHVAIGAETLCGGGSGPSPVGVARFFRLGDRPDAAEVAVTVIDELQGRGLGRMLLRELGKTAWRLGIRHFVATVLPDNEPMRALIRGMSDHAEAHREDGSLVYEIPLAPDRNRSTPRDDGTYALPPRSRAITWSSSERSKNTRFS